MADLPPDVLSGAHLTDEEQRMAEGIRNENRRQGFAAGRWAARQALSRIQPELDLLQISIIRGDLSQPVVIGPSGTPRVSISHTPTWVAALAFPPTLTMGLDIEEHRPGLSEIGRRIMASSEIKLVEGLPLTPDQKTLLLWSAKESLAKALGTGISTSLDPFTMGVVTPLGSTWRCKSRSFPMLSTAVAVGRRGVIAVSASTECLEAVDCLQDYTDLIDAQTPSSAR